MFKKPNTVTQRKIRSIAAETVPTDEALMQKLSQGQLEACAVLFERYHLAIYNFFLRLTKQKMLSEDLTQSVFERLLKYKASYQVGKNFRSWIYQIARNIYADQYQKMGPFVDQYSKVETVAIEAPSVLNKIETNEHQIQLRQALNRLQPEQKEILVLSKWQKLRLKEVAQIMNISEGAAKVRVHRAMQALREQFFKIDHL
ncbi:MAG: ECF family RNA polymerase sigma factor SbrI [Saprospiraceae bacterium]